MSSNATITAVKFHNFKAFRNYSITMRHMNVLVGPNNSGKSTIIGALRALAAGLRKARSRSAERIPAADGVRNGYRIETETLPISLENVHTDYDESNSSVDFVLSNGNTLQLLFPADGGCYLVPINGGRQVTTPTSFRHNFPLTVGVVPVLGPVEHDETILNEQTVRRDLATHRASRQFRNYWYQNPEGFEEFAELIRRTWPGMDIELPRQLDWASKSLTMFCFENRTARELYWAGFGFQVWCQLLTHAVRSRRDAVLIVDEPEVYLHPDVQRQLISILRTLGPDVIVATHSTEIIAESDPSEILLIDKTNKTAQRLRDINEVQTALNTIGSVQNVTLAQIARTRRILFVESMGEYRLLRRFAERMGLIELAAGNEITAVEVGDTSTWVRMGSAAWGVARLLERGLRVAAVLRRHYRSDPEIEMMLKEAQDSLDLALFYARNEIENYLLAPSVIEHALETELADDSRSSSPHQDLYESVVQILERITTDLREEVQAQFLARRVDFESDRDRAKVMAESLREFERTWQTLDTRLHIVPGRRVLRALLSELQNRFNVTLTDSRLVALMQREEIPKDLQVLLRALDYYRTV